MKKRVGELGIIVFGVLIALFAENSWSSRADKATARDYVQRIAAELDHNRVEVEKDQEWVSLACPSGQRLLDHVRGQSVQADASKVLHLAVAAMVHNAPDFSSASFDDIVTTGSLGLVEDAEVREAILLSHQAWSGREAFRPPLSNDFRRAVTRELPYRFIQRVNECLITPEDRLVTAAEVSDCEAMPESDAPDVLSGRLISSPGFESALAERVFEVCSWQRHVTLIRDEIEAVAEQLEGVTDGTAS